MAQDNYRMVDTICIRTDMTIERIQYHPALFFEGQDVSMDNALGVRDLFEEETDISLEVLISGRGPENMIAEELFYRAYHRQWSLHGDCVLNGGRSFTRAEMMTLEQFLMEVKEAALHKEDSRNDLQSAYWERVYDRRKANALAIAPDRGLSPVAFMPQGLDQEISRYFTMMNEEAYPLQVEGPNADLLNESLQDQFRLRIFYDKMAAYMGGVPNEFASWLTGEEEVCGDLLIVGEEPLGADQLAVVMKLMKALTEKFDGEAPL